MFSVGARETDYPGGEEAVPNAEKAQATNSGSPSTNTSPAGGDAVLGGITVVGCEAEGVAAVPQTAVGPGETGQWYFHSSSAR